MERADTMTTTRNPYAVPPPPLRDVATVHEDGGWVLRRTGNTSISHFLYAKPSSWWCGRGYTWFNPSLREWETVFGRSRIFHGDLDQAIAALWAARGTE